MTAAPAADVKTLTVTAPQGGRQKIDSGCPWSCQKFDTVRFFLCSDDFFSIIDNEREAYMKQPNYTNEQTVQVVELYKNGTNVDEIANTLGKTVRSVRSELVREGVYVAQPKKVSAKVQGPTKKELLRDLSANIDVQGLEGATKEAITRLIAQFN